MKDFWDSLRAVTQARIGLGRAGDALPTAAVLELAAAHAAARDAVHQPLDIDALGLECIRIESLARDRGEYLRRPDLGRVAADVSVLPTNGFDVAIVLADGLSAHAVQVHGPALVAAIQEALPRNLRIAPLVVATQARVAIGDHVAQTMRATTVLVLIGERPGLSVADSLGIYLTHLPQPGCTDADRNCISNIHPPQGLAYEAAARVAAGLVVGARRLGRSGVALKDTSARELTPD